MQSSYLSELNSLDLSLMASMSLSVVKFNPIRYTYITVPATAIVVRVHLTELVGG